MNETIVRHENFASAFVPPRHVDVWLPSLYGRSTHRYPVLYMHDGQNLFDPDESNTEIDWGVDEAMQTLIAANTVPPTIVVGVWCTENRWGEYLPQRPFAHTPHLAAAEKQAGPLQADSYLRFLVTELKPFIDRTYMTQPEREFTTIMGSSMGGLISLYALGEYPDVFQGAGCLSIHWPAVTPVLDDFVNTALPAVGQHKLYFDYGTEGLDALYEPFQQRVDAMLASHGYTQNKDVLTRNFPGATHNEAAWRQRLTIPLRFLLESGEPVL